MAAAGQRARRHRQTVDPTANEVQGREKGAKEMTALTIELPDQLVDEAREAGLLSPEAIEAMLRERLERRGIDELLDATRRLAATPDEPAMTLEEIQAEVDAVRAERRARRS